MKGPRARALIDHADYVRAEAFMIGVAYENEPVPFELTEKSVSALATDRASQ